MRSAHIRYIIPVAILLGVAVPALAQYQPPYQPAPVGPAASQASVVNLNNRVVALEQQLSQFLRQGEENAFRMSQLEAEITRLRQQEARLQELERQLAALSSDGTPALATTTPATSGAGGVEPSRPEVQTASASPSLPQDDAAEEAYDVGYEHWRAGRFDQAITALRAMASSFPGHRRVSWANNLAGRAMLDKGEPRAAAEALLANYRANPKGERAADSLFYLGQSLMKLGQPTQACKAYAELEAVYGASMRGELQRLLPDAKAEANCG